MEQCVLIGWIQEERTTVTCFCAGEIGERSVQGTHQRQKLRGHIAITNDALPNGECVSESPLVRQSEHLILRRAGLWQRGARDECCRAGYGARAPWQLRL